MKMFLFASLAAVAAAGTVDLDDASVGLKERFAAFKQQFDKAYGTSDVEFRAFRAFTQNDAIIQQHNSQDGQSFTLGHNAFSDLTNDEFETTMLSRGYNPSSVGREKNYDRSLSDPARVAAAPDSIDWTTLGAVTPIKNQGQCGSCWAFSTVMALEGALFVSTKKLTSLSEQDLVSCDHNGDQGCNGGLMDNAFKWVEENGICTEADYAYTSGTGVTGDCVSTCKPYMAITNFTDVTPQDEDALKVAVAQQPVSVAIEADKPIFQLYKSGVLKSAYCGTQLDHGVGVVGYGTTDDSFKTDYWKVKNSWGASWGMDGCVPVPVPVSLPRRTVT
jgi:C1A family cysteine protease